MVDACLRLPRYLPSTFDVDYKLQHTRLGTNLDFCLGLNLVPKENVQVNTIISIQSAPRCP